MKGELKVNVPETNGTDKVGKEFIMFGGLGEDPCGFKVGKVGEPGEGSRGRAAVCGQAGCTGLSSTA